MVEKRYYGEGKRRLARDYYLRNRDKLRQRARAYWEAHKEELTAKKKAYLQQHSEEYRQRRHARYVVNKKTIKKKSHERYSRIRAGVLRNIRLANYCLTQEEYDQMVMNSMGRCDACGGVPDGSGRNVGLAIDHHHDSGKVRGLLCNNCNVALGMLKDDPVRVHALLKYIERVGI